MSYTFSSAFVFLAIMLVQTFSIHETPELSYLCGARSLTNKVASEAIWLAKGSDSKPYYEECNLIHARYNCSRFRTSATNYQLHFPVYPNRKSNCRVPNYPLLYRILGRRNTNIFMIGDSHMQQIFESLLCIFKNRVKDIVTYERESDDSESPVSAENYTRHIYPTYKETPACHTISYSNYKNFYLASASNAESELSSGDCTLSHFAGQSSCFKLPTLGGKNYSLFCYSYIRPLKGMQAVQAGMNQSLLEVNVTINDFHVVVANTWVSSKDLAAFLTNSSYSGRVLVIPRFPFANQTNLVYTNRTISVAVNKTAVMHSGENLRHFCKAFEVKGITRGHHSGGHRHYNHTFSDHWDTHGDHISGEHFGNDTFHTKNFTLVFGNRNFNSSSGTAGARGSPLNPYGSFNIGNYTSEDHSNRHASYSNIHLAGNASAFNASSPSTIDNPCVPIDFTWLLYQRNDDSKASIYPMSYVDENNNAVECQATQTSPNECIGKDFRVCNFERCNEESHFCMPGPTDELSLLLLSASISHKDHNHHLH